MSMLATRAATASGTASRSIALRTSSRTTWVTVSPTESRTSRSRVSVALLMIIVLRVVVFMGLAKNLGELGNLLMLVAGGGAVLAGVAGAAGLVERMASGGGAGADGWVARRRAATVLALSWVIPVAGGFVLLPACLLMGLGAAVMSVRKGERGGAAAGSCGADCACGGCWRGSGGGSCGGGGGECGDCERALSYEEG